MNLENATMAFLNRITIFRNMQKIHFNTMQPQQMVVLNMEVKNMNKSLYGKTIVNFADSIFGHFTAPTDISSFISSLTGALAYNVGFGGCRMSSHPYDNFDKFSMYRLTDAVISRDFSLQDGAIAAKPIERALMDYFPVNLERLKNIDFSKVDMITIAYGTNDFMGSQPLEGTDKYDINSYGGALRYSIEKIQRAFPHITIVICSQIYRYFEGKYDVFGEDSDSYLNENGNKLTDFVDKTKEIAEEYGLFYINNYNGSGINKDSRHLCFANGDTTHPIEYGRRLIAENIARKLNERFGE